MVNTYTLPFGALNEIPGVSGFEDVVVEIPEVGDVVDPIVDDLLDRTDVDEVVRAALDEVDFEAAIPDVQLDSLVEDFQAAIDEAVAGLDEDVAQAVDDAVGDLDTALDGIDDRVTQAVQEGLEAAGVQDIGDIQVDVGGSLFDIEADFVDLLAAALSEADLVDVPQFPTLEEIQPDVQEAVTDAIEGLPGGTLLTDPDTFIDDQVDRLTDGLVSEDVRQDLEDTLEGLE